MVDIRDADGVGILWLKREDYPRFLALVDKVDWRLGTFEVWEKAAQEAVARIEREGGTAIRVEVDPDQLLAWCTIRGLKLDRAGRHAFACDPGNWPARYKH
jgi:hypothetical protein